MAWLTVRVLDNQLDLALPDLCTFECLYVQRYNV